MYNMAARVGVLVLAVLVSEVHLQAIDYNTGFSSILPTSSISFTNIEPPVSQPCSTQPPVLYQPTPATLQHFVDLEPSLTFIPFTPLPFDFKPSSSISIQTSTTTFAPYPSAPFQPPPPTNLLPSFPCDLPSSAVPLPFQPVNLQPTPSVSIQPFPFDPTPSLQVPLQPVQLEFENSINPYLSFQPPPVKILPSPPAPKQPLSIQPFDFIPPTSVSIQPFQSVNVINPTLQSPPVNFLPIQPISSPSPSVSVSSVSIESSTVSPQSSTSVSFLSPAVSSQAPLCFQQTPVVSPQFPTSVTFLSPPTVSIPPSVTFLPSTPNVLEPTIVSLPYSQPSIIAPNFPIQIPPTITISELPSVAVTLPQSSFFSTPVLTPAPTALPTLVTSPTVTIQAPTIPVVSTTVVNNSLTKNLANVLQLYLATRLSSSQAKPCVDIASLYNAIGNIGTSNIYLPSQYDATTVNYVSTSPVYTFV